MSSSELLPQTASLAAAEFLITPHDQESGQKQSPG